MNKSDHNSEVNEQCKILRELGYEIDTKKISCSCEDLNKASQYCNISRRIDYIAKKNGITLYVENENYYPNTVKECEVVIDQAKCAIFLSKKDNDIPLSLVPIEETEKFLVQYKSGGLKAIIFKKIDSNRLKIDTKTLNQIKQDIEKIEKKQNKIAICLK